MQVIFKANQLALICTIVYDYGADKDLDETTPIFCDNSSTLSTVSTGGVSGRGQKAHGSQ